MRYRALFQSKGVRRPRWRQDRGVALVTVLLLLLLLTAISLTMVLAVSSDMLINGYYRNDRGAFYAADSGANIARQALVNGILGAVPANFAATTQPIPPGTDSSVQTTVSGAYTASTQLNTGPSAGAWPERFKITSVVLNPPQCTVTGGLTVAGVAPTCANPTQSTAQPVTGYKYIYNYSLTSVGQSQGTEAATLLDSGRLVFNATIKPAAGTTVSFAAFGTFIDQYAPCSNPFVPGTLTGPFFTNGSWNFGDSGLLGSSTKYVFTDPTGSASSTASYEYSDGSCDNKAAASDSHSGSTIAPTFQAGLTLGQPAVPLPVNDYNQKRAVLDSMGTSGTAVTNTDLHNGLRDVNGTQYPSTGTSSGVYLPYTINAQTGKATFNGGGIYVEGSATVMLSPSGSTAQMYTITQGGTTTTITIDPASGTTVISSAGKSTTINGIPEMLDPNTGVITENATMLYVDGNITSLTGPGEYTPAIQDGTALTITAAQNVTVTGDIRYKTEPVTTAQNQIAGQPADTLIPGNNNGQVLGIFTATGDIQMNNGQADGNLEIDASIAMISQSGTGGWINVGPHINTLNVIGGRIANQAKAGNTTTRNIFFDRRFSQGGFAPPWYPATTLTGGGVDSATFAPPSVQRLQWLYQSAYQ
jgi:Tfp pilus assembly protein PilX